MQNTDLLPATVLRRKAVVYVRQSTQTQVQNNLESQRRQYDLVPEPAVQDIGVHAMFTRCGGNGCAGLQARGDQIGLELRAVDPACAGD